MKYPYYKVYRYSGGQLYKYGSPTSTGIVGYDLDSVKAQTQAQTRCPIPDTQFVIVKCLSTYRSQIIEVFTLGTSLVPETYTFQDVCDGKVKFNLKPGYKLVCEIRYGSCLWYTISVQDAKAIQVWWSVTSSEEEALDRVKEIVKMFEA